MNKPSVPLSVVKAVPDSLSNHNILVVKAFKSNKCVINSKPFALVLEVNVSDLFDDNIFLNFCQNFVNRTGADRHTCRPIPHPFPIPGALELISV